MKKGVVLASLVVFSVHAEQNQPVPAPAPLQPQPEPDYGPEVLGNFLRIVPSLLVMASGKKSGNPEVAAAGFEQFAQSFSGFIGALEKVAKRKPAAFKELCKDVLNEEAFVAALEEELASEQGVQAVRSWKKAIEKKE